MNSSNSPTFKEGLTFDDVLLVPQFSEVLPKETELKTFFTRNIKLNIPISSAAMDTVTESPTAIAIAQEGGIGIIHKNNSIEEQVKEVKLVKKSEAVMITDPVIINPRATVLDAKNLMKQHNISGMPVIDKDQLIGIVTGRDIRFEKDTQQLISDIMTQKVVTVEKSTPIKQAVEVMHQFRIEKLPVLDKASNKLMGMYTMKDIEKARLHPKAAKDFGGRLVAGAAVGAAGDFLERTESLLEAKADCIVVDTAHGFSLSVLKAIQKIKENFSKKFSFDLVAGNIATAKATLALIEAGVDGIKVGIGPGSICTTRIIAGIGVPQLTSILECYDAAKKNKIPIIADGGIRYSGDMAKALAAGASSVMVGSLLAGTEESPGELIIYQGKSYKVYRGMGSLGAMAKGSKDRYFQNEITAQEKLVPEGIEGKVPYKGPVSDIIYQLSGGLQSALGYVGVKNIKDLQETREFIKISPAALRESHPHDISVTRQAPNYRFD